VVITDGNTGVSQVLGARAQAFPQSTPMTRTVARHSANEEPI